MLLGDFALNSDRCYSVLSAGRRRWAQRHGAGCCDKQRSCSGALLPENRQTASLPPRAGSRSQTWFDFGRSLAFRRLGLPSQHEQQTTKRLQGTSTSAGTGKQAKVSLRYQECSLVVFDISINTDTLFQLYFFYQMRWGL